MYAYHVEIQKWQQTGSVLLMFNRSRINDFYKEYGMRIESLSKEIKSLQELYCVIEEDKIKLHEGKPVLKEGKTKEDFNEAWHDLMSQEIGTKIILSKA